MLVFQEYCILIYTIFFCIKAFNKADVFNNNRGKTGFVLFSKSGFTNALLEKEENDSCILLYDLQDICL